MSAPALDHALGELWSKLRITRVDYSPREGATWDALYRWSPQAVREGINLSVAEALSAGASGFFSKLTATTDLIDAIRSAWAECPQLPAQ